MALQINEYVGAGNIQHVNEKKNGTVKQQVGKKTAVSKPKGGKKK